MKYKLKDHVTDEMLIECGFIKWGNSVDMLVREPKTLLILRDRQTLINTSNKMIGCLNGHVNGNDIKDLIELGYVEVVE